MEEAEKAAGERACEYIMRLLKSPEDLEKIGDYHRQLMLKKASVDTLLKTSLQSQLDDVQSALKHLSAAKTEIDGLLDGLKDLKLEKLPNLETVKEEHRRHSQYMTAMNNLKQIFNVPDTVKRTKTWIEEGKLLYARQSLAELENSRDDLLLEMHKQGNKADFALLKTYFEEVEGLSKLMEKQVRLILARTLTTVRKDPTVIVTALRIVEAEEEADKYFLQQKEKTGFLPPDRPKAWKNMAMKVLESAVRERVEGTQPDERTVEKMWLVRHLELTRQLVNDDLRVVRTLCEPCFPPSWNIQKEYTNMYQMALETHMEDVIQRGLQGNEIVTVLSWALNTFSEFGLPRPLLSKQIRIQLEDQYLAYIGRNMSEWLKRTLDKEEEEWTKGVRPEEDNGLYQSSAPVIIGQMVEQNLTVAKTVTEEFANRCRQVYFKEVSIYVANYDEAVRNFRNRHFANRNLFAAYTHQMIAVLNNCLRLHSSILSWSPSPLPQLLILRGKAASYLLQEPFTDLKPHFDVIFSDAWFNSQTAVNTICLTFEDYFQDYGHLHPDNLHIVTTTAHSLVAKAYIFKIILGKISFTSYEERKQATKQIMDEVQRLIGLFRSFDAETANEPSFEVIEPLIEVLRNENTEMLSLDLHKLLQIFPKISEDQLTSLLLTRGDLSRAEVRDMIGYLLSSRPEVKDNLLKKGLFTVMGKGVLNMDWDHYWASLIDA